MIVALEVPQDDFTRAFGTVLFNLYRGRTAEMRLHVVPDFENALSRIEAVDGEGEVMLWYESSEFQEVAPGVWFPFVNRMVCEGVPNLKSRTFEFVSVTNVNEPLDDDVFAVEIPKGTRVRNTIADERAVFRTGEEVTVSKVDERVSAMVPQPVVMEREETPFSPSRRILIWANAVLVFILAAILGYRRLRNPMK